VDIQLAHFVSQRIPVNTQIAGCLELIASKTIDGVIDHDPVGHRKRLVQAERLGQKVLGGIDVDARSIPLQPIEKIESASAGSRTSRNTTVVRSLESPEPARLTLIREP